jgi:hypothetical protein
MLYTVIIVALGMLLCRYCYIEGVKKTFEIYMKIAGGIARQRFE